MTGSQDLEPQRNEGKAEGDLPEHRHRQRSHRHKAPEYKSGSAKTIRTVVSAAIFVIAILLVWYYLVSRPAQ